MYIAKKAIKVIRINDTMPKTKHYNSRIQQRGIKESTIQLAQELGQVYGDKFILGKKEIHHELKNIRQREKNLLKANGLQIKKGTVLTTYTGGGGGFEQPLDRDPKKVLNDVKNRYVSIEKAKDDYKVSITADLEIDQSATKKLRNN